MNESLEDIRILVVEDEPHIAAGLKLNLELEGFTADVASSSREASHLLVSSRGYDVIILDVMLPDIDGFEFCRRLRASGNLTPVIMLTARDTSDARGHGLEAGRSEGRRVGKEWGGGGGGQRNETERKDEVC